MKRKKQRGNAMLEFAVGAAVFVALFTGTFQYGYSFYVYNNLHSAIRAGARYGSIARYASLNGFSMGSPPTTGYSAPSDANQLAFVAAVQNVVVYGDPNGGTNPVAPGLTTSNVIVDVSFLTGAPDKVWVRVSGYNLYSIFGNWNLADKPTCTMTYQGPFTP